jgi:anti-anti-sigma factor
MPNNPSQLPKEIYHRLYWYAKKNIDPARIAASMGLPLKTVNHFIERFKLEKDLALPKVKEDSKAAAPIAEGKEDFLDIFIFSKTRHTVVDINGSIDKKNSGKLKEMLQKSKSSHRNPIALKMTDVHSIDHSGAETILFLYAEFKQRGRYCAILDPSTAIEPMLKQFGIENKIPIFGTEIAFEEHAFK